MKAKILTATLLGLGMLTSVQAAPKVAEPYQRSINAAWEQVSQAELPVFECTHVVGTAVREATDEKKVADARHAYRVCYVDAALRFSETFFQKLHHGQLDETGRPYGCNDYSRYLQGHVASLEAQAAPLGLNPHELNREILDQANDLAKICAVPLP